jgi:tight adherence protein B
LRSDFQEAILEINRSGQVSKVISILKNQITDTVGVATLKLLQVVLKTGANDLATSLSILSNSSRENHNLIQELKAKQSWVLNGARISIISPWLVLLALWTQESVRNAYQNLIGQLILILVALVGLFGYLVMKRIGRIDVFRKIETI